VTFYCTTFLLESGEMSVGIPGQGKRRKSCGTTLSLAGLIRQCTFCSSILEDNGVPEDIFSGTNFKEFCGSGLYGADVIKSGIAAFPVEEKRGTWIIIKIDNTPK